MYIFFKLSGALIARLYHNQNYNAKFLILLMHSDGLIKSIKMLIKLFSY